jgi:glycosyltransferase involved in cell wall biosynthesis
VLLPPEDPALWARALLGLLDDGRRADALRQKGFARARAFSWERAARATRDVYREAMLA